MYSLASRVCLFDGCPRSLRKLLKNLTVRYIYWGNFSTWEEYYRKQNHCTTIDECYNFLDEDISILLRIKKKNKSKEYTISLQLRTDGEYRADTDDDKNPESSQNHKRKRRHVANEDYEINDYRTDTDDDENPESESYSQNHELHIEEDSQLAQYSFTMLEWSMVNFEMFVEAGWARISRRIKDSSGLVFDQSLFIYVYNDEVLSFDLQTKDEEELLLKMFHNA
ncbi:hypothetical protein RhiirB3_388594 [Rhizophagus irregularis]|nr:hypothetical protein RhiirB3_388594 [Rhizophagus irregularis]